MYAISRLPWKLPFIICQCASVCVGMCARACAWMFLCVVLLLLLLFLRKQEKTTSQAIKLWIIHFPYSYSRAISLALAHCFVSHLVCAGSFFRTHTHPPRGGCTIFSSFYGTMLRKGAGCGRQQATTPLHTHCLHPLSRAGHCSMIIIMELWMLSRSAFPPHYCHYVPLYLFHSWPFYTLSILHCFASTTRCLPNLTSVPSLPQQPLPLFSLYPENASSA